MVQPVVVNLLKQLNCSGDKIVLEGTEWKLMQSVQCYNLVRVTLQPKRLYESFPGMFL
jgi:hypothetical protein